MEQPRTQEGTKLWPDSAASMPEMMLRICRAEKGRQKEGGTEFKRCCCIK